MLRLGDRVRVKREGHTMVEGEVTEFPTIEGRQMVTVLKRRLANGRPLRILCEFSEVSRV